MNQLTEPSQVTQQAMNYAIKYSSKVVEQSVLALISRQDRHYHHGWICFPAIVQALEGIIPGHTAEIAVLIGEDRRGQ